MPEWKSTITANISRKLTTAESDLVSAIIAQAARTMLGDLGVESAVTVKQPAKPVRKPRAKKSKPAAKLEPKPEPKSKL